MPSGDVVWIYQTNWIDKRPNVVIDLGGGLAQVLIETVNPEREGKVYQVSQFLQKELEFMAPEEWVSL